MIEGNPVRRIARTVDCPFCGAYPGEPCSSPRGSSTRDPHRDRIRAAHRKEPS